MLKPFRFLTKFSAASAPVNVKARQSSASAPVEVSWSPPSGGVATITGYRIFYHNQKNIFVYSYVTSIVFDFVQIKDELGKIVSIRSESTQLPSKLINVMVTSELCAILPCSIITGLILIHGLAR